MKKLLLTFFIVCSLCNGFGQTRKKDQDVDIINHEVQLGESVRLISKKYLVDPAEIYKLNKFAVDGISQGMVLKIPVPRKEGAPVKEPEYRAETKEDSKPIVSEEPTKTESVKSEQIKNEPIKSEVALASNNEVKKIVITERKTEINHKVVAKETLYSLARDYNISVDELKASNPEVAKKGLQIGQTIVIPKEKSVDIQQSTSVAQGSPKAESGGIEKKQTAKINQAGKERTIQNEKPVISDSESVSGNVVKHKVEPKETLYSLSKKYNVSIDEIKQQNVTLLKSGLQIGQVLTIKTNN